MPIRSVAQLASAVRARRKELGLSQGALAERAGVSRLWVNQFEAGKPTAEVGLLLGVLEALTLDLEIAAHDTASSSAPADAPGPTDLDDVLDRHRRP
jgi:HTH-type transcriptional regulator/antitoxin HipB